MITKNYMTNIYIRLYEYAFFTTKFQLFLKAKFYCKVVHITSYVYQLQQNIVYLVRKLSDQFVQPVSFLGQVFCLREQVLSGPQRRSTVSLGELVHAQCHAGHVLRPTHNVVVFVCFSRVASLVHAGAFLDGRVVFLSSAPPVSFRIYFTRRQFHFQTSLGDLILFLREARAR